MNTQKLRKSIEKCNSYSRKATGLFFSGYGVVMPESLAKTFVLEGRNAVDGRTKSRSHILGY